MASDALEGRATPSKGLDLAAEADGSGPAAGDGWTAVTRDKSLSAQFEHSVGITETGVEFFTLSPKELARPPYDLTEAKPLQAHVTNLDASPYLGRLALCRVHQGTIRKGQQVAWMKADGAMDGVQALFGVHVFPSLPVGTVGVRSGSLTAAAELLHISQPAASKILKHAEQQLGFALFDRVRVVSGHGQLQNSHQ